jgi:hypothetical protein
VDDYVLNLDGTKCGLCISDSGDKNFATFGDSLLRNYYTVHDKINDRIGFAPLTGATNPKAKPAIGIAPECSYTQGDCSSEFYEGEVNQDVPTWVLVVVILACLLVIIIVIVILMYVCCSET